MVATTAHEMDIFLGINCIPEIKDELDKYRDEILASPYPTSQACLLITIKENDKGREYLPTLKQTAIAEWLYANNHKINHKEYF